MDQTEYALRSQSYALIGAAICVLKGLGHGLHEKPYENALLVELGLRDISCQQQTRFDILYRGVKVGEYIPDLIAFCTIIVDTKVIDRISTHERGQMINYLRITGLPIGLIFNFRYAKLQWERIVLTS
jgi:GxxExxY protein